MPKNWKHLFFICPLLIAASSFARGGADGGGGGDIQCDASIQGMVSALKTWIDDGSPLGGVLDFSSSRNPVTGKPYTAKEYSDAMLKLLSLPLDSMCVSKGDPQYPVMVDKSRKVCKSWIDSDMIHMVCDRDVFLGMNGDDQGQQIHHEYAIHVPGLEPDEGPLSSYKISLQVYVAYIPPEKKVREYREMSVHQKLCGTVHKRPGWGRYQWSLIDTNLGLDVDLEPGLPDGWLTPKNEADLPVVQDNRIPKLPAYTNEAEESKDLLDNFEENMKLLGVTPESRVCIIGNLYGQGVPEDFAPLVIQPFLTESPRSN